MRFTEPRQPHIGFEESVSVEFKQTWQESAMAELCAFANTKGGILYLGISKHGVIVGHDVSDAVQLEIANKIRGILQLSPQIDVHTIAGRSYLSVQVRASRTPLFLRSVYYHRVGSMTVAASHEEMAGLILKHMGSSWDTLPADASIDEIDAGQVRAFVRSALVRTPRRTPATMQDTDPLPIVLQNLRLMAEGRPTNGAMLLFGKDPQELCRAARIKVLQFRDINDITPFPDCTGTLFAQIEAAMKAIETAKPPRETFDAPSDTVDGTQSVAERTQRRSEAQYAELAIREAITNAVVHREYTRLGATVEVKMYDDRIVVLSPGGLPPGISVDALRNDPHISIPRNPLIAATCFMNYVTESYGTGTTRMIAECERLGFPPPEFVDAGGTFVVTFYRGQIDRPALEAAGLNQRQIAIVLYVKETGSITNAQTQQLTSGSKRTASRDLQTLVDRGWLVQTASARGRGSRYVLAPSKHRPGSSAGQPGS